MEHAGERGVQLSVGAELEVYGGPAAASDQFCCQVSEEKPSRKPCNCQHGMVQFTRSD